MEPVDSISFPAHLTKEQAATYLGISVATLDRLLHSGKIPYYKPGKSVRIEQKALTDYLLTNKKGGQ